MQRERMETYGAYMDGRATAAAKIRTLEHERNQVIASRDKWRRIAESGSRTMLSLAVVLSVCVLGLVAVVILWLRATKGAC